MDLDIFLARVAKSTQQRAFFHFTETRNLASIRQHGLLSMRELRRRQIQVPVPGGNDWSLEADVHCGSDAYVHLSFFTEHPMEFVGRKSGRFEKTALISVRPEVVRLPGVMMTNEVANQAGVQMGQPQDVLDELDLDVIYSRSDWRDEQVKTRLKAAKRYEILVPGQVPPEFITNIPNG